MLGTWSRCSNKNVSGLNVSSHVFPDENHISVIPAALCEDFGRWLLCDRRRAEPKFGVSSADDRGTRRDSLSRGTPQATSDAAQAAGLAAFGYKAQLRRSLSLADLLVYGLVFIAPIAPFAIFGVVFNASRGLVPLTYVIGLVAMVFTAISYREMSIAFPISGSVYSYAGRGLHPSAGFLAGWAVLLDYLLLPTLAYVVSAAAMRAIVPSIPQSAWVLLFIVSNTTINLLGIETTARASKIFLAIQLVVIALFIVLGAVAIARGVNGAHWSLAPFWSPGAFQVSFVFNALSVAVLSFLGFDAISTLAEEATGGGKAVGQATMISLCLAAVLFIAQTWIAALLVPGQTEFIGDTETNDAFYTVAAIAGGPVLKLVAAISVALSAGIANALVAQAATSRLLFAMARDGQLPRLLAHVASGPAGPATGGAARLRGQPRPRIVLRGTGGTAVVAGQLRGALFLSDPARRGGGLLHGQTAHRPRRRASPVAGDRVRGHPVRAGQRRRERQGRRPELAGHRRRHRHRPAARRTVHRAASRGLAVDSEHLADAERPAA